MKKSFLILFSIFYFLFSRQAQAAVLYSQAANQDVYEGQTFVVDWYLDTEEQAINVINLGLKFSKDNLEVSEINPGNSLVNLWVKTPVADNQNGTINLTGGITSGINSSKVPIFRTVFRAKAAGSAFIDLDPASQILLSDGRGSSTVLKFKNEIFNIYPKDFLPVQVSSRTHPNPDVWYHDRDVAIKFDPKPGVEYSYSFSSNIEIVPDDQALVVPAEISYPGRPDGIYYFKLNSKNNAGIWQEASVFRVQIDATAPEPFTPEIGSDSGIFDGQKFVSFSTVDKTSGILHYKVKFGWFTSLKIIENNYIQIPKFFVGNQIKILAFDNAGNIREARVAYNEIPQWPVYVSALAILSAIIWIIWVIIKKLKKRKFNLK